MSCRCRVLKFFLLYLMIGILYCKEGIVITRGSLFYGGGGRAFGCYLDFGEVFLGI